MLFRIILIITFLMTDSAVMGMQRLPGKNGAKVKKWVGFEEKRIIPEYEQKPEAPGYSLLPGDLIRMILPYIASDRKLEDAIRDIKSFLIADARLAHFLGDSLINKELIYYLAKRYKGSDSEDELLNTALALGTKGAREWLKLKSLDPEWQKNKNFLLLVIQKIPRPGYKDIAENLIKAVGADINATNEKGDSLLIQALKDKNPDLVEFLMDHGANTNVRSSQGETPSQLALQNRDEAEKLKKEHAMDKPLAESYEKTSERWNKIAAELLASKEYNPREAPFMQ